MSSHLKTVVEKVSIVVEDVIGDFSEYVEIICQTPGNPEDLEGRGGSEGDGSIR